MTKVIRDTQEMISGMRPELQPGVFIFCTTTDAAIQRSCLERALCAFTEPEGSSFILSESDAKEFRFDCDIPMRHIILQVHSALNGVGLTAAVSSTLAHRAIACNIVAAYHHDHVFVPSDQAAEAIAALEELTGSRDRRD